MISRGRLGMLISMGVLSGLAATAVAGRLRETRTTNRHRGGGHAHAKSESGRKPGACATH